MDLNIKQAFIQGQKILSKAQDISCAFDGMELLSFCIDKDKNYVMIHQDENITKQQLDKYILLCEKRSDGYPLQYILGSWEFFGIDFKVGEGVLIPRADTETLVETVLDLNLQKENLSVLDLCSGSGAIAVALGINIPQSSVDAVEISSKAFFYLKENCKQSTNVNPINNDIFKFIPNKNYDIITANPPYITFDEMKVLQKEVTYEPSLALQAEDNGLYFYKNITKMYKQYIKDGGYLVFEIGYRQKNDVETILKDNGFKDIKCIKDLCGNDRVIIGKK